MSALNKSLLFLSMSIFLLYKIQDVHATHSDCKSNKKCFECIQMPGCKWCSDDSGDFKNATERCFHHKDKKTCGNPNAIENPKSEELPRKGTKPDKNSKFQPSKAKVQIRKGEKLNITVEFKDESDRPLDLYILMDLSCTMHKHIKKIETLAENLVKKLKELTSDLKLGFGSFVDKPMAPYSSVADKNENPGKCHGQMVELTYSFKNHLPLDGDVMEFKRVVRSVNTSTNVDAPEGGLDALMQAIVCSKEIGWRTEINSRRIVVFSTDATFHFAGDGKLGGIITPNDGKCHLENNAYPVEYSTKTDYPSISQIKNKLDEKDIYVIFAVTQPTLKLYQLLAEKLQPLSVAKVIVDSSGGNLESGSIVAVIQDEYKKLVGTVNLQVRNPSSFIVKYYAKCKPNGDFEKRSNCTELQHGSTITFKVEIELKECPQNILSNDTLDIVPSLGSYDVFKIEVDMHCGCSCEKNDDNPEENKDGCVHGFKQCGLCKCNADWGGKFCQCSNDTREVQSHLQADCIDKGDHQPCNGRGRCNCGQCECIKNAEESYSGNYCQCDDFSCDKEMEDKGYCNSELGQGKCGCNRKCECLRGFKGSRCQCPPDDKLKSGQENCLDPDDRSSNCNGHGTCTCEEGTVKCKCKPGYTGVYCEIQSAKVIEEYNKCERAIKKWEPCIRCLTLENPNKDFTSSSRKTICEDTKKCGKSYLEFVDRISGNVLQPEVEGFDFDDHKDCRGSIKDEEQCNLDFIVSDRNIHTDITKIYTEKIVNKDKCPESSWIIIVASVVGSTLLIGILTLLIWKVFTHIHDKREFERFESERSAAHWGQTDNPIFKSNLSEFKNPTYNDQ